MHIYKGLSYAIAASALFLASCGDGGQKQESATSDSAAAPAPPNVTIAEVPASPEFADAQISIGKVSAAAQGADSVKVSFEFNVKNYELKAQTSDAAGKGCNNSADGQHIHFILDNKPYAALYEPKHEVVLPKGGEHYLLVFLSRSYHESVKSKGAAAVYHFKIDDKGKLQKMEEPKTAMLFYSRPKGNYVGPKNTDNLLLDFYVWNAGLSDTGYKVKADIKAEGVNTSFIISKWAPNFLKGMPMGKATVTLSLWNKDTKVTGDNTEVSRDITLAADEPVK